MHSTDARVAERVVFTTGTNDEVSHLGALRINLRARLSVATMCCLILSSIVCRNCWRTQRWNRPGVNASERKNNVPTED